MQTLYSFQFIPPDVMRMILDYVAPFSKVTGTSRGNIVYLGGHQRIHMPLLWVCRSSRDVIYPYYCSCYCIDLENTYHNRSPNWYLWPRHLQTRERPLCHISKILSIVVSRHRVYSGNALYAIKNALPGIHSLPLVRSLYFEFGKAGNNTYYMGDSSKAKATNIPAFVQYIKELVPGLVDINVSVYGNVFERLKPKRDLVFGYLLSHLFTLCSRVKFNSYSFKIRTTGLQLSIVRNLVHIDFTLQFDRKIVLKMISQSAPTLKSLAMTLPRDIDLIGLLQGTRGRYIKYPCLHSLKLSQLAGSEQMAVQRGFPDAVPFPSLRRLTMDCYYMFVDDVVFRGNAASLEFLQIRVDVSSLELLQRQRVFTASSHPKLHHVDVKLPDNHYHGSEFAHCMELVMSIGPCAPVRIIRDLWLFDFELLFAPPLVGYFVRVRLLDLPGISPTVWDVISLTGSLPLLMDLRTSAPSLTPMPMELPLYELPAHVLLQYGSIGGKFRRWYMGYGTGEPPDSIICALLLALLCPTFIFATLRCSDDTPVVKQVEAVIASKGFSGHASRLRCLHFIIDPADY